jgi:hypothetical protein
MSNLVLRNAVTRTVHRVLIEEFVRDFMSEIKRYHAWVLALPAAPLPLFTNASLQQHLSL